MVTIRKIYKVRKSSPTIEGAGVHLRRAFGNTEVPLFDPFLLLDDFHSDDPEDYIAGFPWHPHRGIETITYVLQGEIEHGDSMGNGGVIGPGDVQWMTAGSGIVHQEMPRQKGENTLLWGFQLWANLPKSQKMMDPRYRDIKQEQIPEVSPQDGVKVGIISGEVNGIKGPVRDIVIDPEYLDIRIEPGVEFQHLVKKGHKILAYIIEGQGYFDSDKKKLLGAESILLFNDGDAVQIITEDNPVRALIISGKPLNEPIAWSGPVVMNTWEEIQVAFAEYREGTFIKYKK
ncbi:MAG: pirin family protein [Candidatus Helarchaeota archaeon]|nr:pirin family protein [Candidatus Helarchaeota archaeon]